MSEPRRRELPDRCYADYFDNNLAYQKQRADTLQIMYNKLKAEMDKLPEPEDEDGTPED